MLTVGKAVHLSLLGNEVETECYETVSDREARVLSVGQQFVNGAVGSCIMCALSTSSCLASNSFADKVSL